MTVRYLLIALIVVILSALGGWYIFLKRQQAAISENDVGRGAGLSQPFGAQVGSTYENIVSSLSTPVGGTPPEGGGGARLSQVGKTPTAGYGFLGGGPVQLRFIERGSGYVFDASAETYSLERRTKTLVPRTYEAIVTRSERVIMRGVDEEGTIVTTAGAIIASTSTAQEPGILSQTRLLDDISFIVMSPTGEESFFIVKGGTEASGFRAAWDGTKQKKVLASALAGWQSRWLPNDTIVIVQNAADAVAGSAYRVEKNGALSPLIRNVPGLTFLPHPRSSAVLYGESAGVLSLFARIDDKSTSIELPVRTIADKCVWGPATSTRSALIAFCAVPQTAPPANFLDRWYRGEVHTADAWWRVDVSANSAELLYTPGNETLDVEDPTIDEGGSYIAFKNAVDKSLWLLRIKE
ncbi:hypothetical protein A2853_03430 [Candidatus Kaiserbacteria bacterium RIFCSPHIGHO2_01_FULL_55_17]|uniref:Uncharacterized protein n=1 Tax=Candidatus Kaiserbacteria bacterium RIFCSPHIGHO2_01_FULL_55_17 TaxID=1798484 RepID=A0A1F6D9D4_9BACT|nr:MAG: hypothetical protein A2853_03430 [Candidatus Kaiserbacteria bacterium RIFCSPHIGHO2_01_FULL_55_17]